MVHDEQDAAVAKEEGPTAAAAAADSCCRLCYEPSVADDQRHPIAVGSADDDDDVDGGTRPGGLRDIIVKHLRIQVSVMGKSRAIQRAIRRAIERESRGALVRAAFDAYINDALALVVVGHGRPLLSTGGLAHTRHRRPSPQGTPLAHALTHVRTHTPSSLGRYQ